MSLSGQETILAGVAVYMIAMLAIGIHAARRTSTADDFIVAGRSLPLWLCSATVMATWIGGGTMLGVSGEAYEGGLLAVIADPFGAALGLVLVGLLVIRLVRRLELLTAVDLMQQRFGRIAALLSALALAFSSIGWSGALMVAFGYVLNSLTGLPLELGIVAGGVIVLAYTAAGGMWAVALTDFVQLTIIMVGLLVLLVVVVIDLGGLASAWSAIPAEKLRMIPWDDHPASWLNYLRAWFIIGIANLSSQSLLQRGLSARSESVAQNAFYIGGFGYLLVGLVPVFLGILAGQILPGISDGETVVPALAMEYLHPVLMAVFVGALLAAIMSSADSALLSAASVVSHNIIPILRPGAPPERRLLWARITIPVAGVIAASIALSVQTVYELILTANVVQLAAVTGPFILGIWWKSANRSGAQAGMGAGLLVWIGCSGLWPELPGDLLGLFVSVIVMLIVALLTGKKDPPRPLVNPRGEEIDMKDRFGFLPFRSGG